MNDAATNVGVQICLQDSAFNAFDYMELLDHVVILVVIFWGPPCAFSHSPTVHRKFQHLVFSVLFFVCLSNGSHPNRCGQTVSCV